MCSGYDASGRVVGQPEVIECCRRAAEASTVERQQARPVNAAINPVKYKRVYWEQFANSGVRMVLNSVVGFGGSPKAEKIACY
jgi:hypothetical protein